MTITRPGGKVILFPGMQPDELSTNLFRNIALKWLFEDVKGTVTSRTLEWYYSVVTNHLLPVIGDQDINNITFEEVLKLLQGLSAKMPRTAKAVMMLFKRIMIYAYDERYLKQYWPTHKLKLIRNFEITELKYIPQALRGTVLELAAENEMLYPILVTSMFVGLRPGELIAL